jgi:hypothetical protein
MKKFLVGVGNVVAMQNGQIVAYSRTMLNTGFEVSTSNTEIRGGQGNQLLYVYYHTGALSITLEDTQWQLPWIMLNTGASYEVGGNFWEQETIGYSGTGYVTPTQTPIALDGTTINGFVEYKGGNYVVPYADGAFDISSVGIAEGDSACLGYFVSDISGSTITIPANIIPDTVHLFITGKLASDTAGSGLIGDAVIEVPLAQLSGAQTISMTADGYSTTPLTANALAYSPVEGGCESGAYYAKISERISGASPLDGVTALAIAGGDFSLANGSSATLQVYAVKNGRSFLVDNSQLTFSSSSSSVATVGEHTGIVTAAASSGTTVIKAVYGSIEASVTVTATSA